MTNLPAFLMADYCVSLIGTRATAFTCKIEETAPLTVVRDWADDLAQPTDEQLELLTTLFLTIVAANRWESNEVTVALMHGTWSGLGNQNPMVWIREGGARRVVVAAAETSGEQGAS